MLFLVISLLCWTLTEESFEGVCRDTSVEMSAMTLNNGEDFKLSCEFTCLEPQHVVQLWKESTHEGVMDRVFLLNITQTISNVTLALSISSTTIQDTVHYFCRTQPPDTNSPYATIRITTPVSNVTGSSGLMCDYPLQKCTADGLQSQIWCWVLMGKTAILLSILALLAVKYKK